MKRIIIMMALCAAMVGAAQASQRGGVQVSFGYFYSSLAPYGEWIEADAGFYVWRPYHVGAGWRPYLHGRWVWSSHGWYWVSYEPFGWAVFHYGRWYYDDFYGWVWVPGYVWGPAWVEWRYNDDYIGWSPLPPYATFSVSIGIRFSRVWRAPIHYWTFVPCRYVVHHRFADHVVPVERARRFFGSTRTSTRYAYDNGRVINRGVDVGFVERRTGSRVERMEVVETKERGVDRIGRDNGRERIEVYRPGREEIEKAAPTRIEATRPERKLSLDRESIERGTERRGGMRERDSYEQQGRKEPDARRVPSPERRGETEVRKEREGQKAPEPQIQREREGQRKPEPERRPQIKERESQRAPEQDRKRETRVEPERRETRPQSPSRDNDRSSPPRSDRKR